MECKKKRKQEAQKRWLEKNAGYFKGRYDYVKEWRRRKKEALKADVIQDERPPSKPIRKYVLLIPDELTGMIQDKIVLQRLNGTAFAAHGR